MAYEEWVEIVKAKLTRRYKVEDIVIDSLGMLVKFSSGFNYCISKCHLDYFHKNNGFQELCKDIEHEHTKQIMNF